MIDKFCIVKRGHEFWTGSTWTTIYQFCKKYEFGEALDIIHKRFYGHKGHPRIVSCKFIDSRIERKKRKQRKQKEKQKC